MYPHVTYIKVLDSIPHILPILAISGLDSKSRELPSCAKEGDFIGVANWHGRDKATQMQMTSFLVDSCCYSAHAGA